MTLAIDPIAPSLFQRVSCRKRDNNDRFAASFGPDESVVVTNSSPLLLFANHYQRRSNSGREAVEDVGAECAIAGQEIAELLSCDASFGGELGDESAAAVDRLAKLAEKRWFLFGFVDAFELCLKLQFLSGDLLTLFLQPSLLLRRQREFRLAMSGRRGMSSQCESV